MTSTLITNKENKEWGGQKSISHDKFVKLIESSKRHCAKVRAYCLTPSLSINKISLGMFQNSTVAHVRKTVR